MPEITKIETVSSPNVPLYVWLLLAALVLFVYFFGLTIPFLGPDEARYAQVAREMFERGDPITPTLGGFNWFEKPALLYWLQIAAYKLFGVNEFAARLGPALFGLGTIFSLWLLGRSTDSSQISNLKSEISSPSFANWLALVAASSLGIIVFSRGASFDIIITFPITAALVSFYIYDKASSEIVKKAPVATVAEDSATSTKVSRSIAPLALFYVFIGVSLLAKGLIGILFPFAIVGFYYVLSRRLPNRIFLLSLIWGTLFSVAIAATWYLPMYQRHGYEFVNEFFIQHHFQRFTSNKYQHPQPFYFFLWVLPLMTLPWLPFFFASIWSNIRRRIAASPRRSATQSSLTFFATAWLIVPLVFFSFSGSKLPGYILPAVPAAIVLTGLWLFQRVQGSRGWRNAALGLAVSTFAAIILLLIFAVPRFAETDSVKSLIIAADNRGYSENRILSFYTTSHNAEFYAAGRLLRDTTGKQAKFYHVDEILMEIAAEEGRPAVVLVPLEHLTLLTADARIATEVITDNTELAIVIVSAK